jgi:hypothetical protein
MKFYIVLYLTIAFVFSNVVPGTPYLTPGGAVYTDTSSVGERLHTQAAELEKSEGGILDFANIIKSQVSMLIRTIISMASFSFELPDAPGEINTFVSNFFGILSILFIVAVIREVKNLVPFV